MSWSWAIHFKSFFLWTINSLSNSAHNRIDLVQHEKSAKNYIQRSGNQSIHYSQPAVWSSDWFGFYHTKPFTNSGQLAGLVTGLVYTGLYVIIIFYSDFHFSNQTILVYRYIHDMLFEFKKISWVAGPISLFANVFIIECHNQMFFCWFFH